MTSLLWPRFNSPLMFVLNYLYGPFKTHSFELNEPICVLFILFQANPYLNGLLKFSLTWIPTFELFSVITPIHTIISIYNTDFYYHEIIPICIHIDRSSWVAWNLRNGKRINHPTRSYSIYWKSNDFLNVHLHIIFYRQTPPEEILFCPLKGWGVEPHPLNGNSE